MTSHHSPLLESTSFLPSHDVSDDVHDYYTHDHAPYGRDVHPQGTLYSSHVPDVAPDRQFGSYEDADTRAPNDDVVPNQKRAPRTFHAATWLFEILSLGLSVLSLAVLIVILIVYDAQPTPSWIGGLTLNTIISIVSLVFRFGLMVPVGACISQLAWVGLAHGERSLHDIVRFDWASRSPYGSAALLWRTPNQSRLAMLGAALVLLALIVGPFFQQSVAYFNEDAEAFNTSAYISVANSYAGGSRYTGGDLTTRGANVGPDMLSAIYAGLSSYGSSLQPKAPYYCPLKADCRWNQAPTLALEAYCINRDSSYSLECSTSSSRWSEAQYPDHCSVEGYLVSSTTYDPTRTMGIRATLRNTSSLDPSADLPLNKTSFDVASLEVEWFVARGLATANSSRRSTYVSRSSLLEGRQCKIYAVVVNIKTETKEGRYLETLNGTNMLRTPETTAATEANARQLIYGGNQQCEIIDKARGCTTKDSWVSVPLSMGFDNYIDLLAAISDPLGAGENLQRNATTRNTRDILGFLEASSQVLYQTWLPAQQQAPAWATRNTTSSIEQTLYNTLAHVNAALRTRGFFRPTRARVQGNVVFQQAQIKVRWPWLAFPALLILGAILLLWSTIIECEFEGVPLWKDSPLALIMHTAWRRPDDGGVLDTAEDLARESKGLKAGYAGNAHMGDLEIVIRERKGETVEMKPMDSYGAKKPRRRLMRFRK